ncbi:hypothetical protein HNQ59_003978 [Chitinivorax tropicus]|uniref:Uncharacterized protein n=1 Tax=Chitinivorax tropicus TaxID=714531 RepID=A0A840MWA2_9PROT|nr:hypothetical protein [Chitinivorax tropicus]
MNGKDILVQVVNQSLTAAERDAILAAGKGPRVGGSEVVPNNAGSSFANEANLIGHFNKHGGEFKSIGVSTAEDYLQVGRDIMENGHQVQYFYEPANQVRTGYVSFIRNSKKTGESLFGFVGTNADGFITTIHTKPRTELFDLLGDSAQAKLKAFRTDTLGPNPKVGFRWPYEEPKN